MTIAGEWETGVVSPLRGVRRKLKTRDGQDALRQLVKEAELAAEREVQTGLDALARRQMTPSPDPLAEPRARRTLAAYVRAAGAAKTAGFSVALLEKVAGLTVPRLD